MSSQNLWLSLGCPDPIQLTVWAKRKQRWSAEISNQNLWLFQTPTWTNDVDFNAFPILAFLDGVPNDIQYMLVEGLSGVDFNDPTVRDVLLEGALVPDGTGGFTADAFVTVIPVPAAVWLFGSGLLGLVGIARRKKAAA